MGVEQQPLVMLPLYKIQSGEVVSLSVHHHIQSPIHLPQQLQSILYPILVTVRIDSLPQLRILGEVAAGRPPQSLHLQKTTPLPAHLLTDLLYAE